MDIKLWDVKSITFNQREIERAWVNSNIVWTKYIPEDKLEVDKTELYLSIENNFTDTFNVLSNKPWTFNE